MSRNKETRRGRDRADQHWEMAAAVDDANSNCKTNKKVFERSNGELLMEYIEWDLEHDPLSWWAARVYRRRLHVLYRRDFTRETQR